MSFKKDNSKERQKDEKQLEIKNQIEYYLGDENLKKDTFFRQLILSDANGYLDLDYIMKCNKIKKKGWTKEEIKKGVELSDLVELDVTKEKIRKKNKLKLPELSLLNLKKKREEKKEKDKKEDNNKNKKKKIEEEPKKEFNKKDKIIFRIISEEDSTISWKEILQNLKD